MEEPTPTAEGPEEAGGPDEIEPAAGRPEEAEPTAEEPDEVKPAAGGLEEAELVERGPEEAEPAAERPEEPRGLRKPATALFSWSYCWRALTLAAALFCRCFSFFNCLVFSRGSSSSSTLLLLAAIANAISPLSL